MSLTPPRRRTAALTGKDRRAAAAALAVADLTSLRLTRHAVDAAVRDARHRHGGPHGVAAELAHREHRDPRRTAQMLAWAEDVLTRIDETNPR